MRELVVLCPLMMLVACGGGGSNTPTAPAPPPAPTTTSLGITLGDIVLVDRTLTATATATLSNGQTQSVTSGWRSSASDIATVSDSGTVRGVANGTSVISVASGGQSASKTIRVAPDYDGSWSGFHTVMTCRDSGELAGACADPELQSLIGTIYPVSVTAKHPVALEVSGEFVAEDYRFPTFTTQIQDDGAIRFSGTTDDDVMRLTVRWVMSAPSARQVSGTIQEIYTFPSLLQGDLTFEMSFSMTRTGAAVAPTVAPGRRASIREHLRNRTR